MAQRYKFSIESKSFPLDISGEPKDFVLLQIVLQKTEIMNQGKIVFAQIMSLIQKMNSTSA